MSNTTSKLEASYQSRPILGCPCIPLENESQAIEFIATQISAGRGGYTVAINAEKVMRYADSAEFRPIVDNAMLQFPDGFGAVFALRMLHGTRAKKINLPAAILKGAEANEWSLFLLGATEASNAAAETRIRELHPQLAIAGRLDGYASENQTIQAIMDARPQIVLAGLGSPKQENIAKTIAEQDRSIIIVGCGGAIDILAGFKTRAPSFMVNYGLEWLYRLVTEPSRWRRQAILPVFASKVIISALRRDH